MVTYLLLNGAFVNDKNLDGMTPLHVAAKMGASAGAVFNLLSISL